MLFENGVPQKLQLFFTNHANSNNNKSFSTMKHPKACAIHTFHSTRAGFLQVKSKKRSHCCEGTQWRFHLPFWHIHLVDMCIWGTMMHSGQYDISKQALKELSLDSESWGGDIKDVRDDMVWPTSIQPFRGGLAGATWVRVVSIRRTKPTATQRGDLENSQEITELLHASFKHPESIVLSFKMGYSSPILPTSLASFKPSPVVHWTSRGVFNLIPWWLSFSQSCKVNPSCSLGWSQVIFH